MSEVKFFYIRNRWPTPENPRRGDPIGCIAYERYEDPDVEGTDYVLYDLSIASPKDEFSKSRAREIAKGRLDSNKVLNSVHVTTDDKSSVVVGLILQDIATQLAVPKRVRKACEAWHVGK